MPLRHLMQTTGWVIVYIAVLVAVLVVAVGCEEAVADDGGSGSEQPEKQPEKQPEQQPQGPTPDDGTQDLPDPAVRTHCVNVEHLRAPYLASFDWRRWEWDFVNYCGEAVRVRWQKRNPTIEWSAFARSLDVGERARLHGQWAQKSNPPNPITVWCAWVGTNSDPCYRENDYLTNPTNWREMHY